MAVHSMERVAVPGDGSADPPKRFQFRPGWPVLAILVLLSGAAYRIARHGRRDVMEAALCAGLVAVLAHSLVDFGLETLGVQGASGSTQIIFDIVSGYSEGFTQDDMRAQQ